MLTSANCLWLCPRARRCAVLIRENEKMVALSIFAPGSHPRISSQHNGHSPGNASAKSSPGSDDKMRCVLKQCERHYERVYLKGSLPCTGSASLPEFCITSAKPVAPSSRSVTTTQRRDDGYRETAPVKMSVEKRPDLVLKR